MKKHINIVAIIVILLAALSRLLPHPPNMTPIAAMGLFGAVYLGKRYSTYLILIVVLFISDFALNNTILRGFYPEVEGLVFWSPYMFWVYMAFILTIASAKFLIPVIKAKNLLVASIAASLLFYGITNFGVWYSFPLYPKSFGGLMLCFEAGLPFLLNTIIGNVFFVALFFGAAWVFENKFKTVSA